MMRIGLCGEHERSLHHEPEAARNAAHSTMTESSGEDVVFLLWIYNPGEVQVCRQNTPSRERGRQGSRHAADADGGKAQASVQRARRRDPA